MKLLKESLLQYELTMLTNLYLYRSRSECLDIAVK